MKLYNINPQYIYADSAKVREVNGYPNRAVIQVTNTMSVDEWYPKQNNGFSLDGSVLLQECMGMDPETFELHSEETRIWVEKWSYPLEMAEAIVTQLKNNV